MEFRLTPLRGTGNTLKKVICDRRKSQIKENWKKENACNKSQRGYVLGNRHLYLLSRVKNMSFKGLSHEIFRPVFWPVWIYLGLNRNRFCFLNFKEGSLILDSYFKF